MNHELPDASQIKGKGTTLRAALGFVESRWGPEGVQRLMPALSEESRETCQGMILTGSWYPLTTLVEVYEAIDKTFGRGDLAMCWELGEFASDFEVKLLHKVFLKIAKIDYWFKMASATWRMYYSAGRLHTESRGKGGFLTVEEFNPISKAFCHRFGGWIRQTVVMSGHPDVRLEKTSCILDGASRCTWEGTWG